MRKIFFSLFAISIAVSVFSASIIDMIISPNGRQDDNTKSCVCNGPTCICCIDFNVSFIDLGGPGCVRLNYVSLEEGLNLNVSYGESFTYHEHLKGPNPVPVCLNLLSSFAQICARFNKLETIDHNLEGCLQLEPTLLGEPQLEFKMGCFNMGQNGMKLVSPTGKNVSEPLAEENDNQSNETTEDEVDSSNPDAAINADDILAVVNESASKGIAFISDWLGFSVKKTGNETGSPAET